MSVRQTPKHYHHSLVVLLVAATTAIIFVVSVVSAATVAIDVTNTALPPPQNRFLVLIQGEHNRAAASVTAAADIRKKFQSFVRQFDIPINVNKLDFRVAKDISDLVRELQQTDNHIVFVALLTTHQSFGYCETAEKLSTAFNKTIIMWPCATMKETNNYLPTYETISLAVKRTATELNWTQAIVFATDSNWALPLAIASNLRLPNRIVIGSQNFQQFTIEDKPGKVVIICSSPNSIETLAILDRLVTLNHTKFFIIDRNAEIFNRQNDFYQLLNTRANLSMATNLDRLLVLTIITERLKQFMNRSHTFPIEFDRMAMTTAVKRQHVERTKKSSVNANVVESSCSLRSLLEAVRHRITAAAAAADTATIAINSDLNHLNSNKHDENSGHSENNSNSHSKNNHANNNNNCDRLIDDTFAKETASQTIGCNGRQRNNARAKAISMCEQFTKSDNINFNIQSIGSKRRRRNTGESGDTRFMFWFSFFDLIVSLLHDISIHSETVYNAKVNHSNENKFDFYVLSIKRAGSATFLLHTYLELYSNQLNATSIVTPDGDGDENALILDNSDNGHGVSRFWTCGALCWTLVAIAIFFLAIIVAGSVAVGITIRNYLLRKRLSKGPNKIVLDASDFVFPVDARRVDEGIEAMLCCWLQQLQEFGGPEVDKPDLLKGSIASLKNLGIAPTANNATTSAAKNTSGTDSLARHKRTVLDMRARYNGDLVQLKEIALGQSYELKSKAMDHLVMSHGLRHENVNPLIGWLNDPNRTAMVFDCCSRGSLQDVLIMDEIKLDWSFRLSLLTDLVRGMRYLHASPLRIHGGLSSRNCVVDARWVLKITDYGMLSFYDAQGIPVPTKSAKDLLWTCPEVLRQNRSGTTKYGTQPGDVYSFGIIMQEVVVRGEPFCMLSLTPDEIIAKIKRPPPLIRPSVSKGAAPPEAINIMRQCWAESPEMRPDFNAVYERFKQLNNGRKVNFVDTMFQMLEKYSNNLEELIRERTEQLDIERKKTEQLLIRMLPSSVAEKLKVGLAVDPEEFSDVTIYFSDIVGFTTIAAHCSPVQVVDLLNDLYTCFDATINAYNVYKVETIGDAYMVVSGLPVRLPDHAEQIATMALDLLHESGKFKVTHLPGVPLQLRIGLHTGPCCAGVVGLTMPRYCLFGDTVNTASRMESTGSSWRIHMSEQVHDLLQKAGGYEIESRGPIEIKGKGLMNTYWLLGKKGFDKVLPTPPPIGLDDTLIRNSIIMKAAATELLNCDKTATTLPTALAISTAFITTEAAAATAAATLTSAQTAPPDSATLVTLTTNAIANTSATATLADSTEGSHHSASQALTAAGIKFDVKVEITSPPSPPPSSLLNEPTAQEPPTLPSPSSPPQPPIPISLQSTFFDAGAIASTPSLMTPNFQPPIISLPSSYSVDSNPAINLNLNLPEFSVACGGKSGLATSPQQRKMSEFTQDGLLNPQAFVRLNASQGGGGSSSRLFKKIEEMMDLSFPYNHYRCLSPSESNLVQWADGRTPTSTATALNTKDTYRPGSSRPLRRQFSLDKDDGSGQKKSSAASNQQQQQHHHHETTYKIGNGSDFADGRSNSIATIPKSQIPRLHKQHSTSMAQDLEKIEEIPMSPSAQSGAQLSHSSESSLNRMTSSSVEIERGKEINLTVNALPLR